jgi:hypothetical protein
MLLCARMPTVSSHKIQSRVDAQASWGRERRETLDAIKDLRRRQDAADDHATSLQDRVATVSRGLAEVRRAIEEIRRKADEADRASGDSKKRTPDAYAGRFRKVERELADIREFRARIEQELASLQARNGAPAATVCESTDASSELRAPAADAEAPQATPGVQPTEGAQEQTGSERAVATPQVATTLSATALAPRLLAAPDARGSWLAPAVQRIAERSSWLAGGLIGELARLHGQLLEDPLTYELRIEGFGSFLVRTGGGRATVIRTGGSDSELDFSLEGPAAAFAPLVGGGIRPRRNGLKVRGARRKARRLLGACRQPFSLTDLVEADVAVWPDLLLLAMAEATDPTWTAGHDFVVAYAIQGAPGTTVYVQVRDGARIAVSTSLENGDRPASTVLVGETNLLRILAGVAPKPDEPVLVSGDLECVQLLCDWFGRAQGLSEA